MLRRAATSAYSWWWASHIRTKQSKWLEQSLQDMEDVVAETLNIIHNEGESFSQRAEMYYRKRPQLIGYIEEVFRAYRALAERYDHLSKELQSANRTIASVFPEQIHYRIDDDDDDDDGEENFPGANSSSQDHNNQTPKSGIPKAPNIPMKNFRSPSMLISKKGPLKRVASSVKSPHTSPTSGLSKAEALAEVDKLQKEMLALQTEKEFVRSSCEHSYEKYWEIEDQITEMQKRVYSLQDEFDINTIIEDNEARALMAATALNSCKETLTKLQEVQAQSSKEAKEVCQRVEEAHDKYETVTDFISKHKSQQDQGTEPKSIEEEGMSSLEQEIYEHDVGVLRDMIKEKLEENSCSSLTSTEMAEKIDDLVSKVVNLETVVSSQTGLVKRLISEADELQKNILSLEENKEMLLEDSEETNKKLKEVEEQLRRVKILYQNVKKQDNSLQTQLTEASCNLEHLSEKLTNMKPDEEGENLLLYKDRSTPAGELKEESEKPDDNTETMKDNETTKEENEDSSGNLGDVRNEDNNSNLKENIGFDSEEIPELMLQNKDDLSEARSNIDSGEEEDQINRSQMVASELEDREKIMLKYSSVLKNYEDVKDELNDVVRKTRDSIIELSLQVRVLKDTVETKDKEINILQQKLTDESPRTTLTDNNYTPQEAILGTAAQETNTQDPENPSPNTDASVISSTPYAENHFLHVENNQNIGIGMPRGKTILVKVRANQLSKSRSLSSLEKKFRSGIDGMLEENLEFWLRFSTSAHQIQKFQSSIQDLKFELREIRDNNKSQENIKSIQSEIKPIFRHLREIRTELLLWLEHNEVLQEELQNRHPSLCALQDEIARAANPNCASNIAEQLSGYQAAKFQGEVLNMKQENNKVCNELQAGLTFVKGLKGEVENLLEELSQEIGVNDHDQLKHSTSRDRIPLRTYLFGIKLKKQRQSMFACVNPTMHDRQNSDLAADDDTPI